MKKIGIDARLYFQTGVGTYIKNLLYYLEKINNKDIKFYIYLLKNDISKIKLNKNFILRSVKGKWHTFGEQTLFLKDILKDNLDLMHFTYFSYPVLYPRKFIATVHDTTLFHYKTGKASTKNQLIYNFKHFIFKTVFKEQIKKADLLITPTNSVKNDVIRLFGNKFSNKITTIYEGVSYDLLNKQRLKNKKLKYQYFLYVGNFFPHKNIEKLIKAFSMINTDCKLVLIGPNDFFSKRVYGVIKKNKLVKKVIMLKNIKIDELPNFYINAKAYIHPSLSEGFGLPLVEAYYFNCPIIASNISVFKEILKSNYISFNPSSTHDIKNKINLFLKKPYFKTSSSLIDKYSFKEMTFKTYKEYRKVLNLNI